MPKIGLLDYGMGNLYSVQQAFQRLRQPLEPIKSPQSLKSCDALILPGVGAFDPAMENLAKTELIPSITSWVNDGKPLLGICLGLQMLFDSSDEGNNKGLGLIKGHISKLPKNHNERIPHMGWSPLTKKRDCPLLSEDIQSSWMYFVHSYSAITFKESNLIATTKYGNDNLTAIVWHKNTGACQFHPEKSGNSGQRLLSNWLEWLSKNKI